MCDGGSSPGPAAGITRRALLAGTAAAAGAVVLARTPFVAATGQATVDLGGVPILPRAAWGPDLAPTGPLVPEPDVRYLLVHHSVDPGNDYGPGDVASILRGFFRFHTSPGKGWPDLAYNFLVDRFGRVWEGRSGSVAGAVAGDATGGNQGFDQLCCFIGNHQTGDPTPEAFASMARLLGALATRHGIDLADGAMTTFTSRGSNRHPAGTTVRTATVAGHRDMSQTQCPGDRVYRRLAELRLLAAGGAAPAASPPSTATPASTPPAPAAPPAPTLTTTAPSTTTVPPATAPPGPDPDPTVAAAPAPAPAPEGGDTGTPGLVAAGAAAAVAAASGAAWARSRRAPERPPAAG